MYQRHPWKAILLRRRIDQVAPRAAAIVTNVGAPLSHTAIVARELGIAAVVGCGDATQRLKTGDRILVDGGRGLVRLLQD